MNIDKKRLKNGIWYEDIDGNYIDWDTDRYDAPPNAATYHTSFPLRVTEDVSRLYDNKDTCKHPLRFRKRTDGWIRGVKGCACTSCGKTKSGKSHIPFMFMKWENGISTSHMITVGTSLCSSSGECVVAMVNSGDYNLGDALVVMATACERCSNVLQYKYMDGKDGYEEFSEEWKEANTSCEFCEDMGRWDSNLKKMVPIKGNNVGLCPQLKEVK